MAAPPVAQAQPPQMVSAGMMMQVQGSQATAIAMAAQTQQMPQYAPSYPPVQFAPQPAQRALQTPQNPNPPRFSQQQPLVPSSQQPVQYSIPQQTIPVQPQIRPLQQYAQPPQQYIQSLPIQQYAPAPPPAGVAPPQLAQHPQRLPTQGPGYGYTQAVSSVQTQVIQQTTQVQGLAQPHFIPVQQQPQLVAQVPALQPLTIPASVGPSGPQFVMQPVPPQVQVQPGYAQYQYGGMTMQGQAQYAQQAAQIPVPGYVQPIPQPASAPAPVPAQATAASTSGSSAAAGPTSNANSNANNQPEEEAEPSVIKTAARQVAVAAAAGAAEAVFSNVVGGDFAPLVGSLVSGVLNIAVGSNRKKKKGNSSNQQHS